MGGVSEGNVNDLLEYAERSAPFGEGDYLSIYATDNEVSVEGYWFKMPTAETSGALFKGHAVNYKAPFGSGDFAIGNDYDSDTTGKDISTVFTGAIGGTFDKVRVYGTGSVRVMVIPAGTVS